MRKPFITAVLAVLTAGYVSAATAEDGTWPAAAQAQPAEPSSSELHSQTNLVGEMNYSSAGAMI